jgi:hypothetical protein
MKTTLYTVLCIAVRLGVVLLAVNILEQLPFWVSQSHQGSPYTLYQLLVGLFGLVMAAVLWVRPGILAWWAIGKGQREVLESPISADQIQRVAFSVLGMWMVISGLGGCISHLMIMLFLRERVADAATGMLPAGEWRYVCYYLLQVLAGGALVIGSRGLIGLLQRLRGYPIAETEALRDGAATARDD